MRKLQKIDSFKNLKYIDELERNQMDEIELKQKIITLDEEIGSKSSKLTRLSEKFTKYDIVKKEYTMFQDFKNSDQEKVYRDAKYEVDKIRGEYGSFTKYMRELLVEISGLSEDLEKLYNQRDKLIKEFI